MQSCQSRPDPQSGSAETAQDARDADPTGIRCIHSTRFESRAGPSSSATLTGTPNCNSEPPASAIDPAGCRETASKKTREPSRACSCSCCSSSRVFSCHRRCCSSSLSDSCRLASLIAVWRCADDAGSSFSIHRRFSWIKSATEGGVSSCCKTSRDETGFLCNWRFAQRRSSCDTFGSGKGSRNVAESVKNCGSGLPKNSCITRSVTSSYFAPPMPWINKSLSIKRL